jgi:hypothetical protein
MADVFDGGGRKVTTAALIRNHRGQFLVVQRSSGGFNNPGKLSFPGSDGRNLETLVSQLATRLNLFSTAAEWVFVGDAFNPHNNGPAGELKAVWTYLQMLDELPPFSPEGHELGKYASINWASVAELRLANEEGRLSPAAYAVMETFPGLFS